MVLMRGHVEKATVELGSVMGSGQWPPHRVSPANSLGVSSEHQLKALVTATLVSPRDTHSCSQSSRELNKQEIVVDKGRRGNMEVPTYLLSDTRDH